MSIINTLVTDRTQADVDAQNEKGTYNADDLNRVTAAMEYLDDTLRSYGYVTGYQRLEVPHDTTGGDSLLPDGYTELSYIQSSGTQYIDTGIAPSSTLKVVTTFTVNDDGWNNYSIFGSAWSESGFMVDALSGGKIVFYSKGYGRQVSANVGSPNTIECSQSEFVVNGTSYQMTGTGTESTNNIFIFWVGNQAYTDNRGRMKLYSFQMYDNGTLVRDFVPCISDSGAIGLYDIVEEQFYSNAGTGVFTASDAVDEPITGDESDTEYDSYTWYEYDLPTKDLMEIYIANVLGLYEVILSEPELPTTMEKLTYQGANQIEQALVTLNTAIKQIAAGFVRSNSFTFWSGNRPFPTARSDRGRNWAQLDAMETSWSNWQAADWYLLLYGNLKAEGDVV